MKIKSVPWEDFYKVAKAFGDCVSGDFEPGWSDDQKVFKVLESYGLWDEGDGFLEEEE
jgi:hypothetical protein